MQNTISQIKTILNNHTSYAAYRKQIKAQFPDIDAQLATSEYSYAESLYLFVQELGCRPSCKHCAKELKYIDRTAGYGEYCCHACYVKDGCSVDKRTATCLEKYGASNSLGNAEIRKKRKITMIKKYGTEFPLQNKKLKDKSVATYKAGYSEEYQTKRKTTTLAKYGVEHATQSPIVMEQIRLNNLIAQVSSRRKPGSSVNASKN